MLPSSKKKSDQAAPSAQPWHPNFRNYDRLPDIKVVRTAFFVNMVAISVTLIVAAIVCYREYQLSSIERQIGDLDAQIAHDSASSEQAVKLYKDFQGLEQRAQELDFFIKSKPNFSSFLLQVSHTIPSNVTLSSIEFNDKNLILKGQIRGSSDVSMGVGINYQNQLKRDPVLTKYFDDIIIRNMVRNPVTNRLNFEMVLKFKAASK